MSQVGEISVKVSADTTSLERGLDKTKKATKSTGADLKKLAKQARETANTMGKWASGAMVAFAGVASSVALSTIKSVRELKNLSQAANTSVAEFQRGAFAAKQFGIEQEKYGDILKNINDRIGDFITTGAGPMVDFFEKVGPKIGVTIDQFKKLSGPQALQLFVSSLEKANLSQQEMTFHMEAMAGDSTLLLPLLKNNGQEMLKQAKAAEELGLGLSNIDVQKIIEAQKSIDMVTTKIQSETQQAVADLAPAITMVAGEFFKATGEAGGLSNIIFNMAKFASKGFAFMANGLKGIQIIAKGLQISFQGVKALIVGMAAGIQKIGSEIVGGVIENIKVLLSLVQQLPMIEGQFDGLIKKMNEFQAAEKQGAKALNDQFNEEISRITELKSELHGMMMEQLPTQQVDQFFANLEKRMAEAKASAATVTSDSSQSLSSDNGGSGEEEKLTPVQQYEIETIGLLEAMGLRFQSQEEAQLAANQRELEILQDQFDKRIIGEEEFSKRSAEIKRNSAETEREILKTSLQDGFKLLAAGSSKVSKIMEAVAIYQAGVKGAQAAVDAWQYGMSTGGPWTAAAYTAASLAKTGALINNIRGGGKGSGGSVAPQVQEPAQAQSQGQGQSGGESSPNRTFNVKLVGQSQSSETVRELLEMINEEVGNGFMIKT